MARIDGFAVRGFRSFAGDMQFVGPLSKVNLLAGQNNTGKSNVLRFAKEILGPLAGTNAASASVPIPEGLDVPVGSDSEPLEFAIALPHDRARAQLERHPLDASFVDAVIAALSADAFTLTGDNIAWIRFSLGSQRREKAASIGLSGEQLDQAIRSAAPPTRTGVSEASRVLTSTRGGAPGDDLRRILERTIDPVVDLGRVESIEAIREVRAGGEDFAGYSGQGLIEGLARLQNPDASSLRDRGRFEKINRFLQVVLDDPSARLEVPYHRGTIHVDRGGLILPLENLGTGVHEVVILAVAATLLEDTLLCIEEPEIHLHPILQRKLIAFLANETTNTYLIATHSAHLLDAELASIFHVTLDDRRTRVRKASSPHELAAICADLGYRPSDLLQTNAVIWVEGPSDRIYLRHWLTLEDDGLVESIHYSIMFYGGRLLNHLSANDPEVNEFISLRRLNRNLVILIDSDRQRKGEGLDPLLMQPVTTTSTTERTGGVEVTLDVGVVTVGVTARHVSWHRSRPRAGARG